MKKWIVNTFRLNERAWRSSTLFSWSSGFGVTPVPVLGVLERKLVRVNRRIWTRLPAGVRESRPMIAYGRWLHEVVSRRADREMYIGHDVPSKSSRARADAAARREAAHGSIVDNRGARLQHRGGGVLDSLDPPA